MTWIAPALLSGCLLSTACSYAAYRAQDLPLTDTHLIDAAVLWFALVARMTIWAVWR